jgi:hypothetical protein
MLPNIFEGQLYVRRDLVLSEVKTLLSNNFINAIGHSSTVELVNSLLELKLEVSRINVKLEKGDDVIIIQIKEPLPEGKILSYDEVFQMFLKNKIQYDLVRVCKK